MSTDGAPATDDLKWQSRALVVAAVVSLYFGPLIGWPVAIMSAVMAVTAIRRRRWLTAFGLGVAVLAGVSSYVAQRWVFMVVHPTGGRSKQSECRTLLKSIWISQRAFFEDHQRYSENPTEIYFWPEPGTRYSYALSERLQFVTTRYPIVEDGGTAYRATRKPVDDEALLRGALAFPLAGNPRVGVAGLCPDCRFTAVCVANLDGDDVLDIWSISSVDRKANDGAFVGQGDPYCESNDLQD